MRCEERIASHCATLNCLVVVRLARPRPTTGTTSETRVCDAVGG